MLCKSVCVLVEETLSCNDASEHEKIPSHAHSTRVQDLFLHAWEVRDWRPGKAMLVMLAEELGPPRRACPVSRTNSLIPSTTTCLIISQLRPSEGLIGLFHLPTLFQLSSRKAVVIGFGPPQSSWSCGRPSLCRARRVSAAFFRPPGAC